MIVILDAGAAVEIVLQRKNGHRLLQYVENAEWVMAPGLFVSEVTNVFWKYYKYGNLSMEQCESGIDFSVALPDEYSDDTTLYREAFSMGCRTGKPVYDMFYLILARRNNGHLITLDKSLADTAAGNAVRVIQ